MFGMSSVIKIIASLVIVIIVAGALWYITGLRADLAVSQINEQKLTEGIKAQAELLESMKQDIATIQQTNEELRAENLKQRQDVNALANKFDKRDFGAFTLVNPEKAQQLIDRGVVNAFRCLEIASGAPLTDEEKNAPSPIEANRECPALINPNYSSPTN
jgi:ABC-type bacteriocin/lantibiotic exporter with double-glycine peptidase domain